MSRCINRQKGNSKQISPRWYTLLLAARAHDQHARQSVLVEAVPCGRQYAHYVQWTPTGARCETPSMRMPCDVRDFDVDVDRDFDRRSYAALHIHRGSDLRLSEHL